ncbi:GHKL domain-containing protein [Paraliobacillus sp. JSM ZJ581]|uniref:GHKL domain-containing protein n=1 Tax=Paraliobacillus sp. JSM ZJ581 TaxID=3342118 RepID=UPI0035A9A35E
MYIYDIIATVLIGISHILLYFQLIRYNRLSYIMTISLSIIFTILLGIVVTITGYPELNIVVFVIFLLSLGLMQMELTFFKNLYFTLASIVSMTLVKIVLMEIAISLFMWSPFNLYLWSFSLIHLSVAVIITISVWLLRNPIQSFSRYIVESPLYVISYGILIIGLGIALILTSPSTVFLSTMNQKIGQLSYNLAFILFILLLLMVLIGSHLTKERLVREQQDCLDNESLDYVKKLEIMHEELASFRHDYLNILLALDGAIRTGDLKQIEKTYHNVISPTSEHINNQELDIVRLSNIHIPEIKSVLSVKLQTAHQQHTQLLVDIPNPIHDIHIRLVEFIRMISILVDNGIEEAVNSKEKIIQLAFFEIEDTQYFIVSNSTDHTSIDLHRLYEKGYSKKKEKRGYGLFALKQMIDKTPHVTLQTSFIAPLFTQTLMIKIGDTN